MTASRHGPAPDAIGQGIRDASGRTWPRLERHATALLPGLLAVALMLVWAAHNGGYDTDTWYWGALVLLGTLAAVLLGLGFARLRLSRSAAVALALLTGYVAWSYLSIAWAKSPGDALQGSNRALLYLLMFTLMLSLPWTAEAALTALLVFTIGVGLIAITILLRLASADHAAALVSHGRLVSPTGYFNSTVALFMTDALLATVLASRRELPSLLRGVLVAVACAGLQLAVIGQSRGWLFTLPLIVIAAIAIVRERLRVAAAALLPIAATLIAVHRLLGVSQTDIASHLDQAVTRAGRIALVLCAAMLVVGTLLAWAERLLHRPVLSSRRRLQLGLLASVLTLLAGSAGALVATHGDPFGFVKRQWNGFSHPPSSSSAGSHFATVGSGRYDFWRVSLDAFAAHPVGGLGQDNFADFYITRRRTDEEPQWTHSLEMRLLAHTGIVGLLLVAGFLIASLTAVVRPLGRDRRRAAPPASQGQSAERASRGAELAPAVACIALLPLVVWFLHGSVDWFWEVPALTGPALGFLGMAGALSFRRTPPLPVRSRLRAVPSVLAAPIGAVLLVAVTAVLGLPYLSVRQVSRASDIRASNPAAALKDLGDASKLNPLSPDPGRIAGTISLQTGRLIEAERRFSQAIAREGGGWYAWFGDGLAASALGDSTRASHDFRVAVSINARQPAVKQALARVHTTHPLTPAQALQLLVLAH